MAATSAAVDSAAARIEVHKHLCVCVCVRVCLAQTADVYLSVLCACAM